MLFFLQTFRIDGMIAPINGVNSVPNVDGKYRNNMRYPSLTWAAKSVFSVADITSGISCSRRSKPKPNSTSLRPTKGKVTINHKANVKTK